MTALVFPSNLPQSRVLVVGDVMLDRYWHGHAQRISPEAPVPVVSVNETVLCPGGAANVASNVVALGASVHLMGLVGQDAHAEELRRVLQQQQIEATLLETAQPTITKLRVLGQQQQLLRMDFEAPFHFEDSEALCAAYCPALRHVGVVVMSDYAKGSLQSASAFIELARCAQVPVIVDPKGNDFSRYRGAYLLSPNLAEFEAVVGPCADLASRVERGMALIQELDLHALLITLGAEGMLLLSTDAEPLHLPTKARQVFDVTGAGDTVVAVLAATLAAGQSLAMAAQLANIAAGLVVGKLGSASVSLSELRRACQVEHNDLLGIVDQKELLAVVTDARSHGEKVVMTNGCFDLLHAGHVQYLKQARELGDRLIVAVNDDASIRRLKGDARPINALQDRLQLLAALRCVDWVVPFSESTPKDLISAIGPDVLVKGDDYTVSEIAGSEAVLAAGGVVTTLPLRAGCSTTAIVERIQQLEVEKA